MPLKDLVNDVRSAQFGITFTLSVNLCDLIVNNYLLVMGLDLETLEFFAFDILYSILVTLCPIVMFIISLIISFLH